MRASGVIAPETPRRRSGGPSWGWPRPGCHAGLDTLRGRMAKARRAFCDSDRNVIAIRLDCRRH